MDSNISYTGEQDTLEKEQTNTIPEQTMELEVDNSLGSNQEEDIYLGMTDEEFLKSNVEAPTAYQEPTSQPEPNKQIPTDIQTPEDINSLGSEVVQPLSAEDFVKQVTSDFTANGRQVRVEKPEDIVRLMQMGMNYNKKMEAIKPNMGLIKTLKEHGLDNPETLQFLIDLNKHDKTAIAKLLKDSEVDTYDLPDLEETPYTSQTAIISNQQAEFESVLADLNQLPKGTDLIQSLGRSETWDDNSLEFFRTQPEALYHLYNDKNSGMYDEVLRVIDVDKSLGRIPQTWLEKPFVELYEFVASSLSQQQQQVPTSQSPNPLNQQPKIVGHNLQTQTQVRNQPTAPKTAGVTHTGSTQNILADVPDFLAMTDEQFEAFTQSTQGLRFN